MRSYSNDLRERATKYLLEGHTYTETATIYKVSRTALWRWKNLLAEQGNLTPRPRRKYFKKIDPQMASLTEPLRNGSRNILTR